MPSVLRPTSHEGLARWHLEKQGHGALAGRGDRSPGSRGEERRLHRLTANTRSWPRPGRRPAPVPCASSVRKHWHLLKLGSRRWADGAVRREAASQGAFCCLPGPAQHTRQGAGRRQHCAQAPPFARAKIMKPYIPPNYCGVKLGINPPGPRSPQHLQVEPRYSITANVLWPTAKNIDKISL